MYWFLAIGVAPRCSYSTVLTDSASSSYATGVRLQTVFCFIYWYHYLLFGLCLVHLADSENGIKEWMHQYIVLLDFHFAPGAHLRHQIIPVLLYPSLSHSCLHQCSFPLFELACSWNCDPCYNAHCTVISASHACWELRWLLQSHQ